MLVGAGLGARQPSIPATRSVSMRTLALLDESREEYERRRVLIAQRVAEGSQLQQQVEEGPPLEPRLQRWRRPQEKTKCPQAPKQLRPCPESQLLEQP